MKLRSGKEYSFHNKNSKSKNIKFRITPKTYTYILGLYLLSMLILGNYLLHQKQADRYILKSYEYVSNVSTRYFEIFSKFLLEQKENIIITMNNIYKFVYFKYLEFKMRNVNFDYYFNDEINNFENLYVSKLNNVTYSSI